MLEYNDLISQVLNVVPLGQCLSNVFLKSKESLAICEIIANDGSIMIWSISDMPLVWQTGLATMGHASTMLFSSIFMY